MIYSLLFFGLLILNETINPKLMKDQVTDFGLSMDTI